MLVMSSIWLSNMGWPSSHELMVILSVTQMVLVRHVPTLANNQCFCFNYLVRTMEAISPWILTLEIYNDPPVLSVAGWLSLRNYRRAKSFLIKTRVGADNSIHSHLLPHQHISAELQRDQ